MIAVALILLAFIPLGSIPLQLHLETRRSWAAEMETWHGTEVAAAALPLPARKLAPMPQRLTPSDLPARRMPRSPSAARHGSGRTRAVTASVWPLAGSRSGCCGTARRASSGPSSTSTPWMSPVATVRHPRTGNGPTSHVLAVPVHAGPRCLRALRDMRSLEVPVFGRKARYIRKLERKVATRDGIIDEKDLRIIELEQEAANLDARNKRLHNDLKAMRERLPRVQLVQPWTELDEPAAVQQEVEAYVAANKWPEPDPDQVTPFATDVPVTRPYLPDFDPEAEAVLPEIRDAARQYLRETLEAGEGEER